MMKRNYKIIKKAKVKTEVKINMINIIEIYLLFVIYKLYNYVNAYISTTFH